MNTSYGRKIFDLVAASIRSPRDFARYVRHVPAWGTRPADLELPWISYGAIRYLERSLKPTDAVFEFGSGGSTFFLARRVATVLSVETDAAWHRIVGTALRDRGLTNASCEHHPLADDTLATIRSSTFHQRIANRKWNVVFVDCYCGFTAATCGLVRPAAVQAAYDQLAPGGFIVLDDSWMFPELLAPRSGYEIIDFRGLGPCRYGVTSTAIIRRQT